MEFHNSSVNVILDKINNVTVSKTIGPTLDFRPTLCDGYYESKNNNVKEKTVWA
jgi:hypothetical protein